MAFKSEKMSPVVAQKICEGADASLQFYSDINGAAYQWQYSDGSANSNYQDLSDDLHNAGVHGPILTLKNVPDSFNGYRYRCLTTGGYSQVHTIEFENTWTGAVSSDWENAANWSCNVIPGIYSSIKIMSGIVNLHFNTSIHKLTLTNGAHVNIDNGKQLMVH